jgi:hypothetical protein
LIAAEFWLAPHRHGQLTGLFTASAQDPFEIHIYEYELLDWRQYGLRWKRKTFLLRLNITAKSSSAIG